MIFSSKISTYDLFIFVIIFFALLAQGSYFPSQYLTVLMSLSVILLFKFISLKEHINMDNRIFALLLIFTIIYIISTIFVSYNKYFSILESSKIVVFTMFFISISLMKDKSIFLKGVIWGLLGIGILGLLSYVDIIDIRRSILIHQGSIRLQSVIQYANATGLLMGIGFFLSYYFMGYCDKPLKAIKYYVFNYLFLLSLILTLSRGAIISLIICILLWLFFLKNSKVVFYVLTTFVLSFISAYLMNYLMMDKNNFLAALVFTVSSIAVGYIYYLVNTKFKNLNYNKLNLLIFILLIISTVILFNSQLDRIFEVSIFNGTFMLRLIYFKDGLRAIKENFLLGIGPGNWTSQQFFYQTAKYYVKYIHNGLIQIALDAGILGLMTFLYLLGYYYKKSIRGFKQSNNKEFILLIIILFYILLHSLIDINLSFTSILMIFSGILAIDIDIGSWTENRMDIKLFKGLGIIFLGLTVGVSIFLLVGKNYYNKGDHHFIQGKYDQATEYYEKSIFLKPFANNPYLRLSVCYETVDKDRKRAVEMLEKASLLDIYDPRPLRELIKVGSLYQENQLVYDSSIRLIAINKFDILGYESGLISLLNMYKNNSISKNEFNKNTNMILDKLNMANQENDLLSKYVKHNSKLIISDNLMKKIEPFRK